ncbi:MAG TPA: helix-turn-helix transcriptional regulator [Nitrospira sp.]|nr:helix-turn-helix transcriptional regulator [Nitrospira sp.]
MAEPEIEESYRLLSKMYVAAGFKSQKEFARKARLTRGYVCQLLKPRSNGGREPSPEVADRLADVCGRTAAERLRYREQLLVARAARYAPQYRAAMQRSAATAPGMDRDFLRLVRQDLARLSSRQRRKALASAGLPAKLLQQVLRGKAVMDLGQVGRLAKALGRNPGHYLFVAKISDEAFRQLAVDEPEFTSALFDLKRPALESAIAMVIGLEEKTPSSRSRRRSSS